MKKNLLFTLVLVSFTVFNSCNRSVKDELEQTISQDVLNRIQKLGYSTQNVVMDEDGYVVEGDIYLSKEELFHECDIQTLQVGDEEQYRTTYLVTGLPRVITVFVSTQLPSTYPAAVDVALGRFNAQNLQITFQRVTNSSGANISIVRGNGSYLASAGFPTSGGQPHNQVKINSNAIGSNPNQSYLATIVAHELGHCIGFRHTDYMNRAYSCGGAFSNEGASTVGAILIPGTPAAADPNSWMLACIGSGQNRPFNSNDVTALNYLY